MTRTVGIAMALHALGRTADADAALKALVEKFGQDQAEYIATVYGYRREPDAAFQWLDKALAIHDAGVETVLTEPMFDSLHDDPRWLPYLRKIGYAPEQLAKIEFKLPPPATTSPAKP